MDDQEVKYSFTSDLRDLADGINKAIEGFTRTEKSSKSLQGSFKDLANVGGVVKKSFEAIVGINLSGWLASATSESIKFVENLNLFKVALGESVDAGLEFVDAMSEIYGLDPSNLYRYTGYFYQLTEAIGMADDASATLSLSLTKAAVDIASLFNVDVETVVNNLASGMQGMTRAVRKYGIDIRTTTLQQTAYNYGLTEQVTNMSEADRQALRFLTMMEQVANATSQVVDETVDASGVMGDFARNIETPANQLRIFREQVSQLGRAIGNFFIPMLSKLLPILNGIVMAIRTVLTMLSALTGFSLTFGGASTGAANTAKSFNSLGKAAGGAAKAAKELKKTLAPFDELNLLQAPQESSGGGGGGGGLGDDILDPRLAEAIENMSLKLDNIEMKANKVRDALLKFFGFDYVEVFNPDTGEYEQKLQWFADQFKSNLIDKFPQWSKTIEALFNNWTSIIEGIKNVFKSLGEVVDTVKTKIKDFVDSLHLDDKISGGIENLSGNLNSLSSWISKHKDQIADFVLRLAGLVGAFKLLGGINSHLKPILTLGVRLAPVIATLVQLIAPLLAIVATIALLYKNSEEFAASFKNLFSTIVSSLEPIANSVAELASSIWENLQTLWVENVQPMIQGIGDALAPILDTLSVLWITLSELFQGTMELLGNLWINVVSPILGLIADLIKGIMRIIQSLWETVIGPIIENILKSLPELFNGTIKPIIEKISSIIHSLIDLLSALWNESIAPLVNWIVQVLGPVISQVVNTVWNVVSRVIQLIGIAIQGLLGVIHGIIDFIVGAFTGDWQRAWNGIKEIFTSIWNSMAGIVESVLNTIIRAVNSVISFLWNGLQSFVNGLLSVVNKVASLLGYGISLSWGSPPPAIGYVSLPKMATGGVVTGPTTALIGEGHYDEAVIPLGNSPQMRDFADSVADRLNGTEQVSLLKEQNALLRQILEKSGDSVGIRDLTHAITRVQRQELRMGGA